MITDEVYQKAMNNDLTYTNEVFLKLQIWELQHVFCNDASAIKNSNLEFVAFSNQFAEEFYLSADILGKKVWEMKSISQEVAQEIEDRELEITATKKTQDYIFHFTHEQQYINYIMRKLPLINPTTNDVVGILILAIKFDVIHSRRLFLNYMLRKPFKKPSVFDTPFTEQQKQIITCLLLGFHKRKEIASILNKVTDGQYDEAAVKKIMLTLYQKFNCTNISELLDLVAVAEKEFPNVTGINISSGVFPIKE